MAFVFIGQVNVLAPIVTINFMLTYIAVDYSYFSISLSYDVQQKPGKALMENTKPPHSSQPLIFNRPSCHASDGIIQSRSNGTLLEFRKDMDQLFKPFHDEPDAGKKEGAENLLQKVKQKKAKKPAKQMLQDSFLLDLDHDAPPTQCGWDETMEPPPKSQQCEVGSCWALPAVDHRGPPEHGEQLCNKAPEVSGRGMGGEGCRKGIHGEWFTASVLLEAGEKLALYGTVIGWFIAIISFITGEDRVHCNESQEKFQCNFLWKINHRKAGRTVFSVGLFTACSLFYKCALNAVH